MNKRVSILEQLDRLIELINEVKKDISDKNLEDLELNLEDTFFAKDNERVFQGGQLNEDLIRQIAKPFSDGIVKMVNDIEKELNRAQKKVDSTRSYVEDIKEIDEMLCDDTNTTNDINELLDLRNEIKSKYKS